MRDDVLRRLHERFARNWGDSLSQLLRLAVEVEVAEVVSLTGSQFLTELERPTCLHRLHAEVWRGDAWLDMNPAVLHPMLDRLLGGGPVADPIARRPLTEIELQLSARILERLVTELEAAWSCLLPIRLATEKLADDGPGVSSDQREETLRVFRFPVRLGGIQGMISMGIPNRVIERLGNHLREPANGPGSLESLKLDHRAKHPTSREGSGTVGGDSRVEVRVALADSKLRRRDLRDLTVGDIITTEHDVDAPMIVSVAGTPRFLAAPGILRNRTAFRVLEPIAPADESKTRP